MNIFQQPYTVRTVSVGGRSRTCVFSYTRISCHIDFLASLLKPGSDTMKITCLPKMKFRGQRIQKSEPERDSHTDKHATENIPPSSILNYEWTPMTCELCGRIRLELGGGAWCPARQVADDVVEYLQIDLGRLKVITHVETQGRFGNGQVSLRYRWHGVYTGAQTRFLDDLLLLFSLRQAN